VGRRPEHPVSGSGRRRDDVDDRREPAARIHLDQYLGIVKDGVDDTESDAARSWAPAYENYSFSDLGAATGLKVDVDTPPDFEAFMEDTWPKALAKLKALCEERA
jgi:hypothetical protein